MSVREIEETSLRRERREMTRLAWAFGISLAVHLLCYGGYELGRQIGLWQALHWPAWLQKHKTPAELAKERQQMLPQEAPLMFVDVSLQQAVAEAPKDAKYYSDKNSQAANPDADQDSNIPKISGKQTDLLKTEDKQRSRSESLKPNFPTARQEQQAEEAKSKPPPGDLAMAKPENNLQPEKETAEKSKPRTIVEAKMRQANPTASQKTKQEGGVKRRLEMSSLNTKATVTGSYDSRFIDAVSQRWFDLLDSRNDTVGNPGIVVLQFKMHTDGTLTELQVASNTTGSTILGWLCYQAIRDISSPNFLPWPEEMKRTENDPRQVQFTFRYY
jgi:hypothetical protein